MYALPARCCLTDRCPPLPDCVLAPLRLHGRQHLLDGADRLADLLGRKVTGHVGVADTFQDTGDVGQFNFGCGDASGDAPV